MVSILTRGGDTIPITSVREGTPAGISNIARITSVSGHTPLVIALITSVIEGPSRDSSIPPPPRLPSIATGRHGSTPTLNRAVTQDLAHHSTLDELTMHNTTRHHQTAHWATHPAVCCQIAPTPIQTHLPVQSDTTTATDPSTIVTAGGTPIGTDIHLRTAGRPTQ